MRVLAFALDDDRYAVPIEAVREVVAAPHPTRLPTAPPAVTGLFGVRGEIMPLLDTAALLRLAPLVSVGYALVVETPWGPAGLAVTGAAEAIELESQTSTSDVAAGAGVWSYGEGLVVLLDLDQLVNPERLGGIPG